MPAISNPNPLYRIDECQDLMADGYIGDENGNLVFLSVWARDTAITQFLARLTLGKAEDGLEQFHIVSNQGGSFPVFIGNLDRLEKRSTRAYRKTLFGSVVNLWLFDRRCIQPDKANASALVILPRNAVDQRDRLWRTVRETCPLPLLEPWRDTVLDLLDSQDMLRSLPLALGPLVGHRLAINVPRLTNELGALIRNRVLTVDEAMPDPQPAYASQQLELLAA